MENLAEIHVKCKEIFEKELIELDGGRSFACKIWDVMTENKDNHENCLGENFNQLIQTIREDFFDNYTPSPHTKLAFYFTTYILWLYLIVERVDFVFDVVNKDNKSKLFADFKESNFKTSQLIKKWANFIKLGILRRVTMSFRGKRSMYLAGGRVQQMLFQRFKVSY
jgi:hypothetical protein